MTRLVDQHCTPLPPGTPCLPESQWQALLQEINPAWQVIDSQRLERTCHLPGFDAGLALVNRIGALARAQDHHPELLLAWGRVRISLWTHSVGGLSLNDFILAAHIDRLAP